MREISTLSHCVTGVAIGLATGFALYHAIALPVRVIDGDTIERGWTRYRLLGIDAPEIKHAQCPEERQRGIAAADRLRALVKEGRAEIRGIVGRDVYGRTLGRLFIGDREAAAVLIAEGHARKRKPSAGWCPLISSHTSETER